MSSNSMTDYVEAFRANLPAGITFDATLNRYFCNDKRYLNEWEVEAYLNYVKKFGFTTISAYAILNLEPPLVLDFDETFYRTGGTATDLLSAATHARAGNATMFDSDGVLKWGPHNLVTYSEEFDNGWSQTNVTASGSQVTANAGTFAAYVEMAVNNRPATQHTVSMTFPTITGGHRYVWVADRGTNPISSATFDLDEVSVIGQGAGVTPAITTLSDGSVRCSIQYTRSTVGTSSPQFAFAGAAHTLDRPVLTWSGTETLTAKASFYRSDLGGMVNNPARGDSYVPTTSAAVYLPRVGHHLYNGTAWVDEGYFHESEARTNLVTYSQDFTDASWTNSGTSDALDVTGPDGVSNSATTLTASGTGIHSISTASTIGLTAGINYTFSVYAEAGASNSIGILILRVVGGDAGVVHKFDLSDGTEQTPETLGVGQTVVGTSIVDGGNGFYKVSSSITASTTTNYKVFIYTLQNDGTRIYTAGTESIGIYGAQFEAGSTPSSYIPTSGSTVTRAADTLTVPSANLPWPEPVVIGPELVTNGTFDTDTDWTKGTGWTISGGKASFDPTDQVGNSDLIGDTVDLVDGTVANIASNGSYEYIVIGEDGLGYQLSFDVSDLTSTGLDQLRIVVGATNIRFRALGGRDFSGSVDNVSVKEVIFDQPDGTLTLFNHPDNIPRIDYNPDGTVKGLLVEEARTNLATYSEDVTNAAWTKTNLTATSIDTLTLAAGTSTKTLVQIISSSATGRTVSFEAKEGTHRYLQLYFDADAAPWVTFDLRDGSISNSGTTVTGQSSPAPDGWFRYTVTTDSITATNVSFAATDIAATRRGVTASTGTLQLRRIQSEVGSFPTSYIPTSGSTATRAADIASIPVTDFGYNQDQGTVVVEFDTLDTTLAIPFKIEDTGGSTTLLRGLSSSGAAFVQVFNGGVSQASLNVGALSSGQSYKLSTSFKENDFAASLDGGTVASDTAGTWPTTMDVIGLTQSNVELNGHIKSIQYYPRRLTNTQLQELTT